MFAQFADLLRGVFQGGHLKQPQGMGMQNVLQKITEREAIEGLFN